jgi:hypothetical protein
MASLESAALWATVAGLWLIAPSAIICFAWRWRLMSARHRSRKRRAAGTDWDVATREMRRRAHEADIAAMRRRGLPIWQPDPSRLRKVGTEKAD